MRTWALIRDLEEAVFKLKEHLLNVDATSRSSKTDDTDTDVVGKQSNSYDYTAKFKR